MMLRGLWKRHGIEIKIFSASPGAQRSLHPLFPIREFLLWWDERWRQSPQLLTERHTILSRRLPVLRRLHNYQRGLSVVTDYLHLREVVAS